MSFPTGFPSDSSNAANHMGNLPPGLPITSAGEKAVIDAMRAERKLKHVPLWTRIKAKFGG